MGKKSSGTISHSGKKKTEGKKKERKKESFLEKIPTIRY